MDSAGSYLIIEISQRVATLSRFFWWIKVKFSSTTSEPDCGGLAMPQWPPSFLLIMHLSEGSVLFVWLHSHQRLRPSSVVARHPVPCINQWWNQQQPEPLYASLITNINMPTFNHCWYRDFPKYLSNVRRTRILNYCTIEYMGHGWTTSTEYQLYAL